MSQARAFGLLGAAEVLAGVALILGALRGAATSLSLPTPSRRG